MFIRIYDAKVRNDSSNAKYLKGTIANIYANEGTVLKVRTKKKQTKKKQKKKQNITPLPFIHI